VNNRRAQPSEKRRLSIPASIAVFVTALAALPGLTRPVAADPLFWPAPTFNLIDPMPDPHALQRRMVKRSYPKLVDAPKDIAKPHGPLIIAVSIDKQHLKIYDANGLFAESPVSTGMRGHSTPMGVFSIIQKSKWHRSNIYSAAPMPYMQRITWSGVALHAGVVPGYPASHGCIRLPAAFATRLWTWSKPGARVIIAPGDVMPGEIAHPVLMTHSLITAASTQLPSGNPADVSDRTNTIKAVQSVEHQDPKLQDIDHTELRLTSNRDDVKTQFVTDRILIANAEGSVSSASSEHSEISSATKPSPNSSQTQNQPDGLKEALPTDAPLKNVLPKELAPKAEMPSDAAAKRTGHIAVMISGKEKRLYVRQNFEPLFDMPVTIADDRRPLGTHVFTARIDEVDPNVFRWSVISLPVLPKKADAYAEKMESRHVQPARLPADIASPAISTATEALDRLMIPDEAMVKIAATLGSGASIIVSDQGLGDETGIGTDFIVPLRSNER
jgi:lipoprotein-anchoring transpeptidase ErfK/SrfK